MPDIKSLASSILSIGLIVTIFFAVAERPAYAYIDPGSGSFVFQFLVASFFASLFTIKLFWRRIATVISALLRRPRKKPEGHG